MGQIVLDIKNEEKGKFLLDFLKQVDFVEIKNFLKGNEGQERSINEAKRVEEALLNAPVLSEEEIKNIEDVGKEFNNWNIAKF